VPFKRIPTFILELLWQRIPSPDKITIMMIVNTDRTQSLGPEETLVAANG
jgi:hypothetical protein